MIARLGEEIEDALDELLAQALKFETSNAASLSGFLQWFAADDLTIKRALGRAVKSNTGDDDSRGKGAGIAFGHSARYGRAAHAKHR